MFCRLHCDGPRLALRPTEGCRKAHHQNPNTRPPDLHISHVVFFHELSLHDDELREQNNIKSATAINRAVSPFLPQRLNLHHAVHSDGFHGGECCTRGGHQ